MGEMTAALAPESWQALLQAGAAQPFARGQLIYLQGQEPTHLYCLCEGQVRAFLMSDDGEERVLAVYRSGSIFGEASFFDGLPRMSSAEALTPCRIVALDRPTVLAEFSRNPALAPDLLQYLARTVRLLSDQVDHMSFLPAQTRIEELLRENAGPDGRVSLSQDEIATRVGVSRVTVNRALRTLAGEGRLETGYGYVVIRGDP